MKRNVPKRKREEMETEQEANDVNQNSRKKRKLNKKETDINKQYNERKESLEESDDDEMKENINTDNVENHIANNDKKINNNIVNHDQSVKHEAIKQESVPQQPPKPQQYVILQETQIKPQNISIPSPQIEVDAEIKEKEIEVFEAIQSTDSIQAIQGKKEKLQRQQNNINTNNAQNHNMNIHNQSSVGYNPVPFQICKKYVSIDIIIIICLCIGSYMINDDGITLNTRSDTKSFIDYTESVDIIEWSQEWDNFELTKIDNLLDLVEISCDDSQFDKELFLWFKEQFNILGKMNIINDDEWKRDFRRNGTGFVRDGSISIKPNKNVDNKYKVLLKCHQNKYIISNVQFNVICDKYHHCNQGV